MHTALVQLVQPDIAFTAASTMKIPIMVSIMRRTSDPNDADIMEQLPIDDRAVRE